MGGKFIYIFILIITAIIFFALGRTSVSPTVGASGSISKLPVPTPKVEKAINKTFSFPVRDQNKQTITHITYIISTADELDQIIVKGQPATAIQGKTFLVINLKLVNKSNQSIVINTRNYIRLTINNSKDLTAPDIHNDPVEVQPNSTKLTRVGFPINTTDTNLLLHVGEITGQKSDIPLSF
jgi:hypothetical protein